MAKWNVTFAKHYEVTIEADSRDEAEEKACVMEEDEVIEKADKDEFFLHNVPIFPFIK